MGHHEKIYKDLQFRLRPIFEKFPWKDAVSKRGLKNANTKMLWNLGANKLHFSFKRKRREIQKAFKVTSQTSYK